MDRNNRQEMPAEGSQAAGSRYFPVFIDLSQKKIVVIGGGRIAGRRVKTLLDFAGEIQVVAPSVTEELKGLADAGLVTWLKQPYERGLIQDADMVLACTDDPGVNQDVYAACKCLGIPVNCADDKRKCDFYFPGVVRQDSLVIGITASGEDHRRARKVREMVEEAVRKEGV